MRANDSISLHRERFKPEEMTRAGIYPRVIWERDEDEALKYLLDYYGKLVAFYKLAAERGQAVIFAIPDRGADDLRHQSQAQGKSLNQAVNSITCQGVPAAIGTDPAGTASLSRRLQ
jgi:hypothetical protein